MSARNAFERCYICGRRLSVNNNFVVHLEDDDHALVHVGYDCWQKTVKAGYDGVRGHKGKGPMVFVTMDMARAYARREAVQS